MKDGGYKRLMEKFLALRQKVYNRQVSTLWVIERDALNKNYTFGDTFEQAKIAALTGHELRLRAVSNTLVCELVKNPAV